MTPKPLSSPLDLSRAQSNPNGSMAVKIIERTEKVDKNVVAALKEEVKVLMQISHPNIIKLFDFFEEPQNFFMVIELMEGGELFDRIVSKSFYSEKEARDLVSILLNALECVSSPCVH